MVWKTQKETKGALQEKTISGYFRGCFRGEIFASFYAIRSTVITKKKEVLATQSKLWQIFCGGQSSTPFGVSHSPLIRLPLVLFCFLRSRSGRSCIILAFHSGMLRGFTSWDTPPRYPPPPFSSLDGVAALTAKFSAAWGAFWG